ncbi:hypothetical protein BYT27DRAFT_7217361 [Phlegmacium glaucopus]|nr:hypothetical protein BYT27DRAFT_7217361 [Phlegmacium glaucopus]
MPFPAVPLFFNPNLPFMYASPIPVADNQGTGASAFIVQMCTPGPTHTVPDPQSLVAASLNQHPLGSLSDELWIIHTSSDYQDNARCPQKKPLNPENDVLPLPKRKAGRPLKVKNSRGVVVDFGPIVVPATRNPLQQQSQASIGPTTMHQRCTPHASEPPMSITPASALQQSSDMLSPSFAVHATSNSEFSPQKLTQHIIPSEDPQCAMEINDDEDDGVGDGIGEEDGDDNDDNENDNEKDPADEDLPSPEKLPCIRRPLPPCLLRAFKARVTECKKRDEQDLINTVREGRSFLESQLLLVPEGAPATTSTLSAALFQIAATAKIPREAAQAIRSVAWLLDEMEEDAVAATARDAVNSQLSYMNNELRTLTEYFQTTLSGEVEEQAAAMAALSKVLKDRINLPTPYRDAVIGQGKAPEGVDPRVIARAGIRARQFIIDFPVDSAMQCCSQAEMLKCFNEAMVNATGEGEAEKRRIRAVEKLANKGFLGEFLHDKEVKWFSQQKHTDTFITALGDKAAGAQLKK